MRRQVACKMFIVWSIPTLSRKWYLRYLTQTVHSNSKLLFSWQKNCLSKILWCATHILLFLIFFEEKLCVSAHVSKSLAWTMFRPCFEKMLSFGCDVCSMKMGLLKSVSPVLFDKKKIVNFWFNDKILSLLINIQSVNFQSSAQLQNVSFS